MIDYHMIVEINHLLKEKGYDYTIHAIGGCATCGIEFKCHGQVQPMEEMLKLINEYLSEHFIVAVQSEYDPHCCHIVSKWNRSYL